MIRPMAVVAAMLVVGACGKKVDEAQDAMNAVAAAAAAAPKLEEGMKEAEQFQKDRVAKGGFSMSQAEQTWVKGPDAQKVGSVKMDVPYTGGWGEFDKESKDAKITAITRYRYVITVEARNHADDQSAMVMRLAESIATKFDGK